MSWIAPEVTRIGEPFTGPERGILDGFLGRGVHQFKGRTLSLRWMYIHMIEEYAQHNGHADLLRERIDGVTGS